MTTKQALIILMSVCLIISQQSLLAQKEKFSSETIIGGQWQVCTTLEFSEDYECKEKTKYRFTAYEFFANGTFKEDRQVVID